MHEVVFLAFQKAQKRETKAVLNKLVTVEYVQRFTQILWWLILLQKKKARLISKTLNGPSLSANILEALFSLGSCLSLGVAGDPWSTFATKKSSTAGANGQKEDAASSPFFLSVHFWSSCHGSSVVQSTNPGAGDRNLNPAWTKSNGHVTSLSMSDTYTPQC